MTVKKYRVYCQDEGKTVTGWSEIEPTCCFNNNTHTIDTNQTAVVDFNIDTVKLMQVEDPTKEQNYFVQTLSAYLNPHETRDIDLTQNINFNLYSVILNMFPNNIGDEFSAWINKDTPIGLITQSSSGNTITVDQNCINYSTIGFYVFINNDYHRIIDKIGNTIILGNTVTVNANDVLLMTYFMIYKKVLHSSQERLGFSVFNSKLIDKTYATGITYKNKTGDYKKFLIDVETTF